MAGNVHFLLRPSSKKFEAHHHSDSLVVVPEGCAEVLEVGSWQKATSPVAMAAAVEAQEEPRLF